MIGADGARSGIARAVNAEVLRAGRHLGALTYGYWRGLPLDGTHWYFRKDLAAGAIPTNDGRACVFVAMRPERYETHRDRGLEALSGRGSRTRMPPSRGWSPALSARPSSIRSPAGPGSFARRGAQAGRWSGTRGASRIPITAHGMTDALRDAELLARAVVAGTDDALEAYQATRDGFAAEFLDLSDEVASFDWDIERIKVLHHRLSKLMGREEELIRSLEPVGQRAEALV